MTLHPEVKKGFQFREDDDDSDAQPLRNYSWFKLLAKVFKIDVTTCDACGDPMKKISAITDPIQVRRYLKHMNIDYEPPARAPPRYQQGSSTLRVVSIIPRAALWVPNFAVP
ncbi:MAG: hypothetical protein NTZ90_16040 [Proteobacteria bacterium]|nr:hypothetical protein [Pseudomonadota bacterium]